MSIMELLKQATVLSAQTQKNLSDSASQISQLKNSQQALYQMTNQFRMTKQKEGAT